LPGAGQQAPAAQTQSPAVGVALPPLGTNQFRSFVQDTTGQTLSLYGYNLFGNNSFPVVTDVPVPANYVLGPGDEVSLRLWGSIDLGLSLPVDRNGQITVPRAGPLMVAGLRAEQLEARLKAHIGRLYKNFELSATLGKLRSIQVFVVGQARKPGVYTVSSLSTLISALFESGGPTAIGSMRQIQLVRNGKPVSTLDLYKFIHSGDTSGDARLLPGDVIVIPPAGPRVALLGALDSPAIYELINKEEPLSQVLAYSGGQQILTSSHKVRVERINASQDKAPRQVEERMLNAAGLASAVRDGDVITLFKISPEFGNAVTLRGNVANPLRYAYRPGMRVSDLIPEASALIQPDYYTRKNITVQYDAAKKITSDKISGDKVIADVQNMLDEINWEYASIERLDAKEVRTTLIPFNLGKAIRNKDPAHDLQLQSGDVVTIFSIKDLPVPLEKRSQFVRMSGEVMVPGVYQLRAGDTLPTLIARAGGLSNNAYLYGIVFTRESTRLQQQENLDKTIRRLETEVNAQVASNLQNVTDSEKGSAVQAQIAGQKILLDRVKSFKASGRISLELDPGNSQLPPLALEDGDQISVPSRPSFVGVFGEVMAETSFIHNPAFTVANYLDKAGLTRDADLDNIMLVRADGSAETGSRRTAFFGFGSGLSSKKLNPGDTIFVPGVIDRRSAYSQFIQGAKDWTALLYQFGLGAAALKTLSSIN
jgi:protein involved in polysaccharide export with SLBB domain